MSVTAITDNAGWLSESPTSFTVEAGLSQSVAVVADAAGMSAGTYSGTITIGSNDPDEGTLTVGVNLTVTSVATPEMVWIPGGTFQMGSSSSWAEANEQPVHSVTLSPFWMSEYEVTQAQYDAVMGTNPSQFQGSSRPVETVVWYEAAEFCNRLSEQEGLTKFYKDDDLSNWVVDVRMTWSATGYRLPTEAEWEFACRASTTTDYYSGNETQRYCDPVDPNLDPIGWYCGNSGESTHEVGDKTPNAYGLHDMSGNVSEWCNDSYGAYPSTPQTNPHGPAAGSTRVNRGGCWEYDAIECRSSSRGDYTTGNGNFKLGFRVVRP